MFEKLTRDYDKENKIKSGDKLSTAEETVNNIIFYERLSIEDADELRWLVKQAERADRLEEVVAMYQFYYKGAYERLEDCENKLNNNKDEDN